MFVWTQVKELYLKSNTPCSAIFVYMKTIQSHKVLTDIDGVTTKGGLMFGMRQVLVANDDDVKKYWVVPGSEVAEDVIVKAGDQVGLAGRLPHVIMLGAAKYTFPKTFEYNSGGVCRIEGNFYGSDGRYYIARACTILILVDGSPLGQELMLLSETIEEEFYVADDSILSGKKISNITSLYGFGENTVPDNEKEVTLTERLEEMRLNGEIEFLSPYDILIWMENDMDRLTNTLERRIYLRS